MILTIASIVIAVALVVVTYLYMRHTKRMADDTKRMADIMAEEFEFRTAPFIVIDQLSCEFPSEAIGVKIFEPKITNKGFLPVHIVKIVLEWWYKKSPSEIYQKEISIENCILGGMSPRILGYHSEKVI